MKSLNSPPLEILFPEVRVVEASAGSGKTFCLARRYLQLLFLSQSKQPLPIRPILAITFTNKAASQMKLRILEYLKKIALGKLTDTEEASLLGAIGLSAADLTPRAKQMMDDIIQHYNFFQVQTIDSFINALLSGCSFRIHLSANFKIITESSLYLEASLDQLIYESQRDARIERVFKTFLTQYLFIEKRTGWFPKKDLLKLMQILFAKRNTFGKELAPTEHRVEDLFILKNEILSSIKSLQENLPTGTHAKFRGSLNQFVEDNPQSFDIDSISDYFARDDFPITKGHEVPEKIEKLWDKIRDDLKELVVHEAKALFNPYIELYQLVEKRIEILAAKDDVLFLEELNTKARHLFDESGMTVEELYYRLATRFRHFLIDEFQDTSLLQWQNFEMMIEEALSTGGSLFYVGDKKQAIYGFRGGEVKLFDYLKSKFKHFNVSEEYLKSNFRSLPKMVEFNNTLFSVDNLTRFIRSREQVAFDENDKDAVFFADEDWKNLENIFHTVEQAAQKKGEGYVKMEMIQAPDKDARDAFTREKLISLVSNLKSRWTFGDIAILTRDNEEVEMVTQWLLEAGMPVDSEKTSNIQLNPLIQELTAFLKFLESPMDNLNFAKFLLGEIFSQSAGVRSEEMHHFILQMRAKMRGEKNFYLYKAFREKYPLLWERYFEDFFKKVGLFGLYEFVISIYKRFDCVNLFPSNQGFFMRYLELIKEKEKDLLDISEFLEYFENPNPRDLYLTMVRANAIRILTVHKSKGLEFPVVILPFLGMKVQIDKSASEDQQSFVSDMEMDEIHLMRFKKKYCQYSDELKSFYDREYKKAFINELKAAYVALTRAEYELYGFIPNKIGVQDNIISGLIPENLWEVGRLEKSSPKTTTTLSHSLIAPGKYFEWLHNIDDELVKDLPHERSLVRTGERVHYMLSLIKNLKGENWPELLKNIMQRLQQQFSDLENPSNYEGIANRLIQNPKLKEIFYVDEAEIYCERAIVTAQGQTRRMDRIIITKNEVWVIDYKASSENMIEKKAQVDEYKQILKTLHPQKTIRGFIVLWDTDELTEL